MKVCEAPGKAGGSCIADRTRREDVEISMTLTPACQHPGPQFVPEAQRVVQPVALSRRRVFSGGRGSDPGIHQRETYLAASSGLRMS